MPTPQKRQSPALDPRSQYDSLPRTMQRTASQVCIYFKKRFLNMFVLGSKFKNDQIRSNKSENDCHWKRWRVSSKGNWRDYKKILNFFLQRLCCLLWVKIYQRVLVVVALVVQQQQQQLLLRLQQLQVVWRKSRSLVRRALLRKNRLLNKQPWMTMILISARFVQSLL